MMEFSMDAIVSLLMFLLLLALTAIFVYQSKSRKRRAGILNVGLVLGIIASLITFFNDTGIARSITGLGSFKVIVIYLIVWAISYLMIFYFFNYIDVDKRTSLLDMLVHVVFGVFLASSILLLFEPEPSNLLIFVWDLSYNGLGIIVFFYGAAIYYITNKRTGDKYSMYLMIASLLIVMGFIFGLTSDTLHFLSVNTGINDIFTYGDHVKAAGISAFLILYITNVDYIYRLPIKFHALQIFLTTGIPLYNARFKGSIASNKDYKLLSGALSGIIIFVQTFGGKKTLLRKVEAGDWNFLIRVEQDLGIVMISEKVSKVLETAMNDFSTEVLSTLSKEDFNTGVISQEKIKLIEEHIGTYFPFLDIEKTA